MGADFSCIVLQTQALTLEGRRVQLDEETFGVPIAGLNRIEIKDRAAARHDYQSFSEWCEKAGIMLCSTRIAQSRITESMFLEERGFRFVELNYVPHLGDLQNAQLAESEIKIVSATKGDQKELAALAERTFQTGRFHQDPRIAIPAANRRYGQWMWRAFQNPNQSVLKCLYDGKVIGFFVVETPKSDERFWSLVGLGPEFTGRGLGYATWTAMMRHHQAEGARKITTSVSSHNIAVMNLYARLGFRFPEPQITLHWHPEGSGIIGS